MNLEKIENAIKEFALGNYRKAWEMLRLIEREEIFDYLHCELCMTCYDAATALFFLKNGGIRGTLRATESDTKDAILRGMRCDRKFSEFLKTIPAHK